MSIVIINRLPLERTKFEKWLKNYNDDIYFFTPEDIVSDYREFATVYGYSNFRTNGNVEKDILELFSRKKFLKIYAFEEAYITRASSLRSKLKIEGQKTKMQFYLGIN